MHALAEVPPPSAGADHLPPWRTAEERQAAARHTYRSARQRGQVLTGAELAARYQMSERWGRDRVAEVRADATNGNDGTEMPATGTPQAPAGSASGNHQPAIATSTGNPGTNGNHDCGDNIAGPPIDGSTGRDLCHPAAAGRRNGNRSAASAIDGGSGPPKRVTGDGVEADTSPPPKPVAGVRERSWADLAIILAVASVAAAASYGHMLNVALIAGEPLLIARAFPITVDGLVLAALRNGERGRNWLTLGIAVSIAANVLAQFPELAANAGPFISAWPPVALYGTHRLLHRRQAIAVRAGTPKTRWTGR